MENWKKTLGFVSVGVVIGGILTFLLITWAQYSGCSVDFTMSLPPKWQLSCAGAPHQVAVNFGNRPSRQRLGDALAIIAQLTQSRGPARLFVTDAVLNSPVASVNVDPPAGAQPSLTVVQQLLAQAQASDAIGVCIVPDGGYRVQTVK